MTGPRRRFDAAEVGGEGGGVSDAEIASAMLGARALEASLSDTDGAPSADLADRIMTAVRREPAPRAIGIIAALQRRPSLAGLVDSLRLAADRAVRGRTLGLRATALAYVAAVLIIGVSLSGIAAYGVAGALGLFVPASHQPDATHVLPTPGPIDSPEATEPESPEPGESADPADSMEPGQKELESHQPGQTEDVSGSGVGETSSPGQEDRAGGGDGGGGGGETAAPSSTRTPDPTHSPRPSSTPQPTGSASPNSDGSAGSDG